MVIKWSWPYSPPPPLFLTEINNLNEDKNHQLHNGVFFRDNTVAIIVVCSILGFFAIITIALILRAKCCPYWSPKEAISDCTSGWKCCQKNETKMHISTVSPAGQLKEREKRKLALAPVKRHMSDLKIVMQTPKPGTYVDVHDDKISSKIMIQLLACCRCVY